MTTTPRVLPRLPRVEEVSAGGVAVDVVGGEAYIAVISRENRVGRIEWCLPKGHREGTETLVETAQREVAEETGIVSRALVTLGVIDYWFTAAERRVHKRVHHYLLEAVGGELTVENDPDQEALEARWVRLEDAHRVLTFPNEQRIARMAWRALSSKSA